MTNFKKMYRVWVLLVVAAMLIPGCGPSDPDCARPEIFCVGLVTDMGKINDKSFNQLAWEGLKLAQNDLGASIQYIETVDPKDFDKNISSFADAGYDVIITVGSGQKKVTTDAAFKYPKIYFIGVEQFQNPDKSLPRNLAGLVFPEDQAGFLAGALAAQMTKSGKIGAVCGPDTFPPAWRYGEGFKAGAAYIDPAVQVTVIYHNGLGFNDSMFDPEWDAVAANSIIGDGVDVIFGADGHEENGAVTAAAQQGIYAIGVNTDQYLTLGPAQPHLLSSATKLVTRGVFNLIEAARFENFLGGNFFGRVGYAPYHDLDSRVPSRVKVKMAQIQRGLANGSIETGVESEIPADNQNDNPAAILPTPTTQQ